MTNKLNNLRTGLSFYLNQEGVEILDYSIIDKELHITLLERKKAIFITFILSHKKSNKNYNVKFFNINDYQFQVDLIDDVVKYIKQVKWHKITCHLMDNLREVNVLINSKQKIYLDNIYHCFDLRNSINFYLYDSFHKQELSIDDKLNDNLKIHYQLALIRPSKHKNIVTNPVVDKLINYFLTYIPIHFYNQSQIPKQVKFFQI